MIKWSEFKEGDSLFEAFLPEHDRESAAWLLRWSCNGHVIEERRVRLIWPPRFGPDVGDVAKIEAELDTLINNSTQRPHEAVGGAYVPREYFPLPSEPHVLAGLAVQLAEYVEAEAFLGLDDEQTREYLGLPDGTRADGLYPMAITPEREGRMRRIVALTSLLRRDCRAQLRNAELLAAVLAHDVSTIAKILEAQGIES